MSYILSNQNRFYTALESSYGAVASISAANRIPAIKLGIKQQLEAPLRRDKTGSRTFAGMPPGGRLATAFELDTYLTTWTAANGAPAYGPLFQSAMGGAAWQFNGGTIASAASGSNITFSAPHGLVVGQAIASGNEIRFAAAIASPTAVILNAPFTTVPAGGASIQATMTYSPGSTSLPSVSIFDYWSPTTAVQRLLHGAVVDQMQIRVNGDYHEFGFRGLAQDLLDTSSFASGVASLQSFPAEPAPAAFDYSIVPGNLGQAWLGTAASEFFTLTSATVSLKNNLESRSREFGSQLPLAMAPGRRDVAATMELYSQDDAATTGLYQAARQQSPISVMFQLGSNAGQMFAVYLQSVIPVVPEFDDRQNRLQWQFRSSRAQGTVDNEIQVAFA